MAAGKCVVCALLGCREGAKAVELAVRGDDQWSNMLGGTELIRRKLGKDAHAMTITLLTDSNGNKMGKTAGNAAHCNKYRAR